MKSFATIAIVIAFSVQACAAQQQHREARLNQEAPTTAPSTPATPSKPSDTWLATRVVHISMDDDENAARAAIQEIVDMEIAAAILQQHGIAEYVNGVVEVRIEPQEGKNAMYVQIKVDLSRAAPTSPLVAREVANDLVRALRQRLVQAAQGSLAYQAERLREERAAAEAELATTRDQLNALRAKMRDATGRADASAERVRDEVSTLEDARQEIQLDLESKAARMKALSDNIAQLSGKVEARVQNDPVAAELQKVVDAREKQVEMIKGLVESGKAGRNEYEEAIAAAAEARARLLDRRTDTANAAGGESLNAWNRDIMSLSVDTAELQARLDRLSSRLDGFRKIMNDLDSLESLNETRRHTEDVLRETSEQLRHLQRQLASIRPPRSILLESKESAGPIPPARQSEFETIRNAANQQTKPSEP